MVERVRWCAYESCDFRRFRSLRLDWGIRPKTVADACDPPVLKEFVMRYETGATGTVEEELRHRLYCALRVTVLQKIARLRELVGEPPPPKPNPRLIPAYTRDTGGFGIPAPAENGA